MDTRNGQTTSQEAQTPFSFEEKRKALSRQWSEAEELSPIPPEWKERIMRSNQQRKLRQQLKERLSKTT